MSSHDAYTALAAEFAEASLLSSTAALLSWDEQCGMPHAGGSARADQCALLARLVHAKTTSPRVGELLNELRSAGDLDADQQANVRQLQRGYDKHAKLPASLVSALAKQEVLSQQAWVEARKNDDFAAFSPWLETMLELKREVADAYALGGTRYDALLDDFEPHASAAEITSVFQQLREPLVKLVQQVLDSPRKSDLSAIEVDAPVEAQKQFGTMAAKQIGFDFSAGRLDVSVHPFCSGIGPGDTRITTRFDPKFFPGSFFGVLHETGHGMYEQGLPKTQLPGLPLSEAISLGIHESQSRMWENLVGRSRAFWQFFSPKAREAFPALKSVSDETLLRAINDIAPSFIRVEADEATYNLHILLRFELEHDLVQSKLAVKDLPDAWNAKMQKYLGIAPPNDTQGCLQDVHWSCGLVGYFPTYTLGNLYASQFFETAQSQIGDQSANFASGNFAPLLAWLRENIHQHGRRYTASELVQRVTGKPLSPEPLLRHLSQKVSEFYA